MNWGQQCCVSHPVVPDSLWPHGLKPTRLFCPWDFPGKDTGMDCHLSQPQMPSLSNATQTRQPWTGTEGVCPGQWSHSLLWMSRHFEFPSLLQPKPYLNVAWATVPTKYNLAFPMNYTLTESRSSPPTCGRVSRSVIRKRMGKKKKNEAGFIWGPGTLALCHWGP